MAHSNKLPLINIFYIKKQNWIFNIIFKIQLYLNFTAVTCKENQVYEIQTGCPKTCLNPDGNYDCGAAVPIEGCYCKPGYLVAADGSCILPPSCGCTLPDNSGILEVRKLSNILNFSRDFF